MPCWWQAQPPNRVAAEVVLAEAEALDLRAHGAVEDQDALARRIPEGAKHLGTIICRRKRTEEVVGEGHRSDPSWSLEC